MKKQHLAVLCGAAFVCASLSALSPAHAQETPTGSWGSTPTWADPNRQAAELAIAEGQLQARSGGFRPPVSNTYYNAPVTTDYNQQYLGPVSSSSTTNAANYSSSSALVDQHGSTGASAGIQFSTGETSGTTTQTAKATIASNSGNGNQSAGN